MKDASVVRDAFEKAGQGHVFKFYDSLDETAKKAFVEQLGTVDVERCNRIFKLATTPSETSGENVLEPLPTNCFDTTIGVKDPLKIKAWEKLGCELINKGEVSGTGSTAGTSINHTSNAIFVGRSTFVGWRSGHASWFISTQRMLRHWPTLS